MVTHTGKYFFFASGVPRFGSSATAAISGTDPAAHMAAAAASIIPLLVLLSFISLGSSMLLVGMTAFWEQTVVFAHANLRRSTDDGRATARKEAVMVTDAIVSGGLNLICLWLISLNGEKVREDEGSGGE
ncbi:hypothetical protein IEQ34_012905 [Dendrobium chrysotoxum]|uniref:Uncharacterized protein n=1 Tax=Dendrobium chrysotoxum TaxID=161865 RepID=A0AAV7G6W3_DENCH|nr:hypothetical protein IEQ34_012905 [Dendrobium chrysotoxum]